jgi:hypothetical protein
MDIAYRRLQAHDQPGSMGVVTNARYINCYWPALYEPAVLFAPGSSGISVLGRTPRNVLFPAGTVFQNWFPDAIRPAELAVARWPLIDLADAETATWVGAYADAVAALPLTATMIATAEVFLVTGTFARRRWLLELTRQLAADLVAGVLTFDQLKAGRLFRAWDDPEQTIAGEHVIRGH